jgi:UDP-GlcNAc:undecaprenyl-phosphate GlcNAc-1-phosphate transferase
MTGPARLAALVAVTAALGWIAVALARRIAVRAGAVAKPNPIVRGHRAPVAYLGGAAWTAAWLVGLALAPFVLGVPLAPGTIARALATLGFAALGTVDDLRVLSAGKKFAAQFALCAAYLAFAGARTPGAFAFQMLVLVSMVNAFNLIDVMDGLLCAVFGLVAFGLLVDGGLLTGALRTELPVALGALLALFAFNAPSARIYAGDGGSLTLGFLAGAWLIAAAPQASGLEGFAFVGLCAAPALELLILIPARLARGRSPFQGSPDHFALRLQDQLGWSRWRVLGTTLALGAVFALAPWVARAWPAMPALVAAAVALACGVTLWYAVWRLPPVVPVAKAANSPQARAASK